MNTYSDFNTSFAIHPTKGTLSLKTDINAVIQSCRSLLLTDKGERLFQPRLGSNIRAMLFENFTPQTSVLLKQMIVETINNFEPRAAVIDVTVSPNDDMNSMNVAVILEIINNEDPVSLNLVVERTR